MIQDVLKTKKIEARKNKNVKDVSFISFVISEIEKVGKNIGNRETTNDEAIVTVKKIMSNIEDYIKLSPDNTELIYQKNMLQSLLPQEASVEDIREFIIYSGLKTQKEVAQGLREKFGVNINMKVAMQIFKELTEV